MALKTPRASAAAHLLGAVIDHFIKGVVICSMGWPRSVPAQHVLSSMGAACRHSTAAARAGPPPPDDCRHRWYGKDSGYKQNVILDVREYSHSLRYRDIRRGTSRGGTGFRKCTITGVSNRWRRLGSRQPM